MSLADDDVKIIALSLISNIPLGGISLTVRQFPTPNFFTTDEVRNANNILTDAITLLVILLMKYLHKEEVPSYKASVLEDVACLFVATSRVGLGLRMICENLIAVKFQQSTGYLNVSWAWKAIIASCVMEIMYRRSRFARTTII